MKVLHVIPSVGPLRGGPSFAVRTMAEGLAARGVFVDVAATDDNGPGRLDVPHERRVLENGVGFYYFPRQARFYTASWPLYRWLAAHVTDYDLVHIHALFSFAPAAAALCAARDKVPYIVRPLGTLNLWGMQNRRPLLKGLSVRMLESRLLANAAFVHFTSEQERIEAEAAAGRVRSFIVPNPVSIAKSSAAASASFFSRHSGLRGKRLAIFLSRIDQKKGLDLLLDAFASVRRDCKDVALVIAGGGDPALVAQLRGQARSLGLEGDVVWTGFLEGADKLAAFSAADLYVLPSYSENFGIAVVEAMACGLPVVVSDQVGIHRDISRAGAGLVVACDARQIASAMTVILSDPETRARCSSGASQLAARFTPDSVAERLCEHYQAALSPRYFQSEPVYNSF